MELLLQDNNIKDQQWSRFLTYLVVNEKGKPYRDVLQNVKKNRLLTLLLAHSQSTPGLSLTDKNEMQYQAVRIISLLIKYDDQWLSTQHDIIEALKRIWCNDQYQVCCFIAYF